MVLAFPVALGVLIGLVTRGDLRKLATLRLRRIELFYLAFVLQLVAFPVAFIPWETNDRVATALWLASYGLLVIGAIANRKITGVPVVAAGMLSNVIAVVANGGHMPALPQALRAAHKHYSVHFNSAMNAKPRLPWLVDRWAVPHWIPFGNVYSVGDAIIAVGVVLLVVAAMQPRLLKGRRGRDDVETKSPRRLIAAFAEAGNRPSRATTLDPISPELALVSPELAEEARMRLPARPWEMFVAAPPALGVRPAG
jgi:hypothetical protein